MSQLDAIVLAEAATSRVRIAGLTAMERAIRVALKVGASRVIVVGGGAEVAREHAAVTPAKSREELAAWRGDRTAPVLVIRADQLVHTPLVAPLLAAPDEPCAIAVGPDDEYAGALLARGDRAASIVERLAHGDSDNALAEGVTSRIPHGAIARHPIATVEERRGAHRLLYQLMVKPQDNAITRYLYRPIAAPLTKLLAWTPITPNQISCTVAVLVALGCWLTLQGTASTAIAGAAVILVSSYLDCCDGEIARLKLMSSRMGAWIDTIVDELSTLGYMVAIGWHCHLVFGPRYFGDLHRTIGMDPWVGAIWLSLATYGWCIYAIYYNIIVAVGSANSQDYVGRFEVAPGSRPNAVRLQPKAPTAIVTPRELPKPVAIALEILPNIVRRDFICWLSFFLACMQWTNVTFAMLVAGGSISAVVLAVDHIKLRNLRRSIERSGRILESPNG